MQAGGPKGILATGSTHTEHGARYSLRSCRRPLAAIKVGMLVLGVGIPAGHIHRQRHIGNRCRAKPSSDGDRGQRKLIFVPLGAATENDANFNGQLVIPKRGILKVLPGDVIAVDNTGWPILVSAAAIGYAGALWTFT